jgi:hypothetical protein
MRSNIRWLVATSFLLAVLVVQPALAGSGVGGVFNLGVTNTVNKTTVLKGSV